jgi:hypothetical protein
MMKTGVFRSQLLGSTILFILVISFNSGTLASIKTDPGFLPNLIQPELLAMLFYYNGNLADTGVGTLQLTSACSNRRLLRKDKEYPCLIE